ncbi:hypothetical protein HZB02_06770 [Candidatus Woesearchaeota archaeon]|nr:hypothetical protein [Candidatus Woesearchaeota archaeon]
MLWTAIRKTSHYEQYHKQILAWSDVIRLIYLIKNKRKKGDKIEIENDSFYILCECKDNVLYVINVKKK